jgi:predicted nucleotidyltransferase
MKLSSKTKNKIINYFRKKPEIAAVYMYGSQSKGGARADSDVDLAVLVSDKRGFGGFDIPQTRYTYDLERLTGKKVEVQDLGSVAIDFAHRVLSEGELLLGLESAKRVEFEEYVLRVYFDMKPSIDEYFYYLRQIVKKGDLGVRYI